jgi:hypothetical protein
MFNNLGGGEMFIVIILILILLVHFLLRYFIGLSKGRKEHLKTIKI